MYSRVEIAFNKRDPYASTFSFLFSMIPQHKEIVMISEDIFSVVATALEDQGKEKSKPPA